MPMEIMQDAPPNVRVLATDPDDPNIAYLWVVEEGDTVAGATVPGLRICTWLFTDGFAALRPEGLRLVNQLLAYALGVEEIPDTSMHDYMLY